MIQRTKWSPDTCSCVVEYEWDDSVSEELREHIPVASIKCEIHKDKETHEDVYLSLMAENQTKNIALAEVLTSNEKLQEVTVDKDGNEVIEFKQGTQPEWEFDQDRNLIITTKQLDETEKGDTQEAVDTKVSESPITVIVQ